MSLALFQPLRPQCIGRGEPHQKTIRFAPIHCEALGRIVRVAHHDLEIEVSARHAARRRYHCCLSLAPMLAENQS